jgi:light-regulated signal transduction histidine kinase (bacteriophytochrome)
MNRSDTSFDPAPRGSSHAVAAIQPHGVLLVIDGDAGIAQVGGDTQRVFGHNADALLGKPLAFALGTQADWLPVEPPGEPAATRYMGCWLSPRPGQRSWDVTAHWSGHAMLLEFEPAPVQRRNAAEAIAELSRAMAALDAQADEQALCDTAAAQIRRLSGFDRVYVHRFGAETGGAPVAQATTEAWPIEDPNASVAFLRLDTPSPSPADHPRAIADAGQQSVPLVPQTGARAAGPVDISRCVLWSGPPDRLRQLVDHGVVAAVTLPVVYDVPWGLIACHHRTPKWMPYEVREACHRVARHLAHLLHARGQSAHPRQLAPSAKARENTRRQIEAPEHPSLAARARLLVQETHHRVQNSLHIVASLLRMQARQAPDAQWRAQLDAAVGRLLAVGAVHRHLGAADDTQHVQLGTYLEQLCADLVSSWGEEWAGQVAIDACDATVSGEVAVTLSLIVTELLTNAVKYAYGGTPGPIALSLQRTGRGLRIVVRDEGRGIDGEVSGSGLGSRLIRTFASQLGARVETLSGNTGTTVTIILPFPAGGPAERSAAAPPGPGPRPRGGNPVKRQRPA